VIVSRLGPGLWILLVLLGLAAGPAVAGAYGPAAPPAEYDRSIEIKVVDLRGRPLAGAEVDVMLIRGRLVGNPDLVSDARGRIRLRIQPVIQNPMDDLAIEDRFLSYQTAFQYRIFKSGYVPGRGEVQDEQEFAGMSDPLFQALDRVPDPKPLTLDLRLIAYREYLSEAENASSGSEVPESLRNLILDLVETGRTHGFELVPGSLALSPGGTLRLGLRFEPMFDPADFGLQETAAVLLREPIQAVIRSAGMAGETGRVRDFEFEATARFQSVASPFVLPVDKTYVFRLAAEAARRLTAWNGQSAFSLEDVRAEVDGQAIDLEIEMNPEAVLAAPGGLLKPVHPRPDDEPETETTR